MSGHFWVFALATLIMNLTPGNDVIYVISRSAGQGVKAGIISALGIMAGCLVHITAAAVGLSAIIAASATAFDVIKYVGAAYLIYLGIRALFNRKASISIKDHMPGLSYRKVFWQGVITNALNPKVALFFLAFIPQFIDVGAAHPRGQALFLGVWFNISGTVVNILYALLFGRIGKWLSGNPGFVRIQEKVTGLVLIILGIKVALTFQK
ncbi:MAG: LysE family translocator [Chitinophagaceae bacterium]|nr:LysE family translocator [Chitinophagaceae bacterium]